MRKSGRATDSIFSEEMISLTDDFAVRLLQPADCEALHIYLMQLSPETKKRFAPHAFDAETIHKMFFASDDVFQALVAIDTTTEIIVAYTALRRGIPPHDIDRYMSYGIKPCTHSDCLIAPSVTDALHGKGLGSIMLAAVLSELQRSLFRRIFLWGGVQSSNHKAIRFYQKHGFITLGQFEHHGTNHDMYFMLTH